MRNFFRATIAALLMTAGLLVPAGAAGAQTPAGSIDLAFGSCGVRQSGAWDSAGDDHEGSADAVAVQPDGKIVLAGSTAFPRSIMVIRLLPDGRWDHTFGTSGSAVTFVEGGDAHITAMALQPDGRIVVAGSKYPYGGGQPQVLLARYLPNGALDTTFGLGGVVTHSLGSSLFGLALQPDGKLVGVGERIFRLLSNGALDPGFGTGGLAPTGRGSGVAIQADGKIVVPFDTVSGPPAGDDYTLLRLLPDGAPDPTFDTTPVDFGGGQDSVSDVALAGDGGIITSGSATVAGPPAVALTRHLANGALDLAFGDRGRAVAPSLRPTGATPVRMAIQDDNKVVVAYTDPTVSGYPGVYSFALARFTADGTLDDSFGDHGVTITPMGDRDGTTHGLARQPSGDWVVGGSVTGNSGPPSWAAAVRYHGGATMASVAVTTATCRRDAELTSLAGANFGAIGIGMHGVAHTFVLTNTGTAPVTPTRVTVERAHAGQFRIVADACTGATVGPGTTCAISMTFVPTVAQTNSVELVVWDDAGWGWQTLGVQGEGITALSPQGWGGNGLGQLANTSGTTAGPITMPNAVSVAAGYFHSLALKSDGTVWAWGWNGMGQLGDGTNVSRTTPVKVGGLTHIVAISAGGYHSLALRDDGTLWAWGWNYFGQLGDGSTADRWVPARVVDLPPVTTLSGGWIHSLAVGSDGSVRAWGWNGVGQLGDGSTVDQHRPVIVPGLSGIGTVAAGVAHSLAVRPGRSVFAWGWNALGQLGDGTTTDRSRPVVVSGTSDVDTVSAGGYHSLAVRGGQVWAWGWNGYGQLGDGSTVSRFVATPVPGFQRAQAISGGFLHTLAVENDGTVRAWGWNSVGQLGDGSTDNRQAPTTVYGVRGAKTVSAGALHSLSG